jgi:hypothetical protein
LAALFQIQLWSAELRRSPPVLYFLAWTGAMRSFARPALLFSPAWQLLKQLGLSLPPSPSQTRPFRLIAEQICYLAPRQQALLPLAFAQALAPPQRISFRAAWVSFAPVRPILKGPAPKTALLAWKPLVSFREQRLPPAHGSARQEQRCRVAPWTTPSA